MAALTVTAYDSAGTAYPVQQITQFSWEFSKDHPYAVLKLSALDLPAHWIHRLEVYLQGKSLFSGRMDTEVWEQTSSGSQVTLTARSQTASLVDHEAAPVVYQNYSLAQLLYDHGYPYGLSGSALSGGTLSQITCAKGMSHWEFLQFILPAAAGIPALGGRRSGAAIPFRRGEIISFSQGDYRSFTLSLDRTGLIARLYVLDQTDQYRLVQNRFAQSLLAEKNRVLCTARPVESKSDPGGGKLFPARPAGLPYREVGVGRSAPLPAGPAGKPFRRGRAGLCRTGAFRYPAGRGQRRVFHHPHPHRPRCRKHLTKEEPKMSKSQPLAQTGRVTEADETYCKPFRCRSLGEFAFGAALRHLR